MLAVRVCTIDAELTNAMGRSLHIDAARQRAQLSTVLLWRWMRSGHGVGGGEEGSGRGAARLLARRLQGLPTAESRRRCPEERRVSEVQARVGERTPHRGPAAAQQLPPHRARRRPQDRKAADNS